MQIFRQRITQNAFALLLSSGGSTLLSLLLFALIGRGVGEVGLGIYAIILAWVFPLSILVEFGLGTLLTRDVAQALEHTHAYLVASVKLRIGFGSVVCAGLMLAAPLISDNILIINGLRIAAPLILILPLYGSFTAIFRAHQNMRPIAWLGIGMLLIQVILIAIILALNGDIVAILWINTLTSLMQLVLAMAIYRRSFYHPTDTKIALQPLLKKTFPFAIAAVLGAIQLRMDIIVLEQLASTTEVGYYAAALRFLDAGRLASRALLDALYPAFAERIVQQSAKSLLRVVAMGLLIFGSLLALLGYLLSEWALVLIYGERFIPATSSLQLMAISFLPMLLRQLRMLYGFAQGDTTIINLVTGIMLIVQFSLCLWLIPPYGAYGAALSIFVAESIAVVVLWCRPAN